MRSLTRLICLLNLDSINFREIDPTGSLHPSSTQMGFFMHDQPSSRAPALASLGDVTEFARMVLATADSVHATLRRLSASSAKDPDLGYSVLTEEYAIRARANILMNDSVRHLVKDAGFSQDDLRKFMISTEKRIAECSSMASLLSTSTDVITFASAVSSGNARILMHLSQAFGLVEAPQRGNTSIDG